MFSVYRYLKLFVIASITVAVGGLLSGCTLDGIDDELNTTISNEDLRQASSILGESMSDDNSGVMLSIRDALSIASEDGFRSIAARQSTANTTIQVDRSGRGSEQNYSHRYESSQGKHVISFKRVVDLSLFSKEVVDTLSYIYKDAAGSFIQKPAEHPDRINSIFFTGKRTGKVEEGNRTTNFTRRDTFSVDQLTGSSSYIALDGVHTDDGFIRVQQSDGSISVHEYHLEINFLNMEIHKSALANENLYRDLTGTLSWKMDIQKQTSGIADSKTLQGTVILNGDGTGRLLFQRESSRYQVNLNDGEIRQQDREFEGELADVNTNQQTVTLVSGRVLYMTDSTEVDGDDGLETLDEVRTALQNGVSVWTEGEGFTRNERFYITEIEFEGLDEDDEEINDIDFEDVVTDVDPGQQIFTLNDSISVSIDEQTEIDDSGDYLSLEEVDQALKNGQTVTAEGDAVELSSSASADLRALEVEFEKEDSDDSDGESDSDN